MKKKSVSRHKRIKPITYFWIITFLFVGSITVNTEYKRWQIEKDPAETYAIVYAISLGSGHGYVRFYRFEIEGTTYYGRAFSGCEIGDWIKVRYLRSDPSKNRSVHNE